MYDDPTYGRIDRDIQWTVDTMLIQSPDASIATRVALENSIQDKRNRRQGKLPLL